MELPRLSAAGDFLGGLKDRLPSRSKKVDDDYYEDDYYEDDYYDDDFGPDGYDDGYSSSPGYYDSEYPQLVNSDDIRASVRRSYAAGSSEPPAPRIANPARDEFNAYEELSEERSDGIPEYVSPYQRSLVEPQPRPESPAQKVAAKAEATGQFSKVGSSSRFSATSASSAAAFDPYNAYQENRSFSRMPTRKLTTIKPMSYNDVQGIARAVRAGDAVVLALRFTDSNLSRRILDFSFGVASAMNARVDCIADKVFVITTGPGLTADEKRRLQTDGTL